MSINHNVLARYICAVICGEICYDLSHGTTTAFVKLNTIRRLHWMLKHQHILNIFITRINCEIMKKLLRKPYSYLYASNPYKQLVTNLNDLVCE